MALISDFEEEKIGTQIFNRFREEFKARKLKDRVIKMAETISQSTNPLVYEGTVKESDGLFEIPKIFQI